MKSKYHTFIHYIDLKPLKDEIKALKTEYQNITVIIKSHPFTEMHSFNRALQYQLASVEQKFNSISPIYRVKRGLIDGLGTIIKSISGNLDANDAIHYDQAIFDLQNNQKSVVQKLNKEISLTTAVIENYNQTITLIRNNQRSISSGLNTIRSKLNELNLNLNDYIECKDVLDQVNVMLNMLSQLLSDIENAIVFARLGTIHSSILKHQELESILKILLNLYSPNQLIFSDVYNNTHRYYEILQTEAYYSGTKIVFLIHFPIVFNDLFSYYHLYSIPNQNSTTIIPPSTYLIMNENFYQYASVPCIDLQSIFYCPDNNILNGMEKRDCIFQLLQLSPNETSCTQTPIKVKKNIIQQIDESHYIVIFPNHTKIRTTCQRTDFMNLQGNYLIQLPFGCQFETNNEVYSNKKYIVKGQPMLLPKIKVSNSWTPTQIPAIDIQDIKLDKIHEIVKQQTNLQPIQLNHTNKQIGYWTLPIYVIIILGLSYLAYKIIIRRKKTSNSTTTSAMANQHQADTPAFFTP